MLRTEFDDYLLQIWKMYHNGEDQWRYLVKHNGNPVFGGVRMTRYDATREALSQLATIIAKEDRDPSEE